jgi:hypothetical protein
LPLSLRGHKTRRPKAHQQKRTIITIITIIIIVIIIITVATKGTFCSGAGA